MEITPRELRDTEIPDSWRGYDRDVVNDMLERAATALEAVNERLRQMSEHVNSVQADAGRTRETEDILHRTLLLAQRAADEAVAEAQQKSRQMLDEAEITSRKLLSEAEADARRRGETERRRLEEEILDLSARRDALLADMEAMTRFEAEYRDRMVRALEADLTALRTRSPAAPGPRPEPSDVELPSPESMARRDAVAPEPGSTHDVRSMVDQQIPATLQSISQAAQASMPATTAPEASSAQPATGESPETHDEAPASAREMPEPDPAARPSPFDELREAVASPSNPPGQYAPPAAPDLPLRKGPAIDLEADEVEAEVLDDDAFFATLREAVHDDAPLGPREDESLSFFDNEDENDRGSFRDVFRRRR